MSQNNPTRWIGVDWGTTNIRAYLIERGRKQATTSRQISIADCAQQGFPTILADLISGWEDADALPVLICGMAGSKQGWVEAPYVTCPAGLDELAGNMAVAPGRDRTWIVPGLSCLDEHGRHDVIRGEETQLLGLVRERGFSDGLVCAPGTHNKWVHIEGGRVASFRTSMTGEMFNVISEHTILALSIGGKPTAEPGPGFQRGLDLAATTTNLLADLFKIRSGSLFDVVPPEEGGDHLSGLLIGYDVRHSLAMFGAMDRPVPVIGPAALGARYALALEANGMAADIMDAEPITLAGLGALAGAVIDA